MCLTFFQPYTVAASAQIISLNITKGTITEVFKAIEDQSEYKFFYNDNQINLNKRVDVNIHEESIEQVLNNVFRGTDITYKIVKNHVVLTNKTMKDTELPSTNQNRKRLTGQVVGPRWGASDRSKRCSERYDNRIYDRYGRKLHSRECSLQRYR